MGDQQQADVVVVGGGIMGASAAWQLARRGLRVTVLEQFDLNHARGSSHGTSRIFRLAYDDPDYVRLARRALPLWREVERELKRDLLRTTGGLDLGPPHKLAPIAGALTAAGIAFERLARGEVARRFPQLRLPDGWEAIHQPDAGVTAADTTRHGLLDLAQRAGARILPRTAATRLLPEEDRVVVETGSGSWRARVAVVTAAGWSNRLLRPLGLAIPLTVTREHVAYYPQPDPPISTPFMWHLVDPPHVFYGLPSGGELKVGQHGAGPVCDPDEDGDVEPERLERVERLVRAYFPTVPPARRWSETCLYASTPDDDFVIERHGPIVLGIGFGGHGFKFGPLMGTMLADLAEGGRIPLAERFSRRRLACTPTSPSSWARR